MSESFPAITPLYTTPQPNVPLLLYEGPAVLEQDGQQVNCEGQIRFEWLPSPRISFSASQSDKDKVPPLAAIVIYNEDKPVTLHVPGAVAPVPVQISGNRRSSGQEGVSISLTGHCSESLVFNSGTDLQYVIFHLVNFEELLAEVITDRSRTWMGRVTAEFDNWKFTLDTLPGYDTVKKTVQAQHGYVITHAARLEQADGTLFSVAQVEQIVDALFWYFSFARGFISPPILPVGFDATGKRVWENWRALRAVPWTSAPSWFSDRQYVSLNLQSSLSGFLNRWQNPQWNQTLKLAIHYYVESNTDAGGVEGSIILAQVVLETLAATYFMENGRISADGFEKFPAADAIRLLLLSQFNIPIDIPSSLPDLVKLAKAENWVDGPQALTTMRNILIHVTPKNRDKALRFSFEAQYQVLQLSLWYIELALLHLFDYQGYYVNRLRKDLGAGVTEPVPWKLSTV